MTLLPQGLEQRWDEDITDATRIQVMLYTYPAHPRPRAFTDALKCEAVRKLVVQLRESRLSGPRDAQDLKRCLRPDMDGYQLARTLETLCGWEGSTDLVEALDNASDIVRELLDREQKGWVRDNAISPPYPDGTHVRLPRGETGALDGVYEYGPAQYKVKLDGDAAACEPHRSRRIVHFEDVKPFIG